MKRLFRETCLFILIVLLAGVWIEVDRLSAAGTVPTDLYEISSTEKIRYYGEKEGQKWYGIKENRDGSYVLMCASEQPAVTDRQFYSSSSAVITHE